MPILSNVTLQDLQESTKPITLPSELGWSVEVLCTGTTPLSQRRLCVLGCSLGGHWFRPPKTFTDEMVVLTLLARKDPQHYSIVNVPYEHGKCASWYADWDTRLVDFYKTVVKDLFSLKVSSKVPIFFWSVSWSFECHGFAYFSHGRYRCSYVKTSSSICRRCVAP